MALFESLVKSSSFSELLGEDILTTLRCPVCMDFFNEPVILACGHTFCYDCLHDMSMHTKSKMMNIHIRNVRINCPNCRIPVYVMSIIQKRCTTNYTLASFLESLKEIKVPIKTYADAETNTEIEENAKDEEEESYDYDEEKLNKMRDELDGIFLKLQGSNNVVGDAWRDIAKLRKEIADSADVESVTENNLGRTKPRKVTNADS